MDEDTNELADAINKARTAKGLPTLKVDPRMTIGADKWASGMALSQRMQHGMFGVRIDGVIGRPVAAGECLAEGQTSADAVVEAWLNDPPHAAILLGDFDSVGVGRRASHPGTLFWCADFAKVGIDTTPVDEVKLASIS